MEELDNIDNNNKNKEENLDSPKVFINNAQILESGQILITPPKPDEKTFEDWKRTSDQNQMKKLLKIGKEHQMNMLVKANMKKL